VSVTTTGSCHGDHLVLYLATDASYAHQTLILQSYGAPLAQPCGYWQADFMAHLPKPTINHATALGPNTHGVLAYLRGHRSCTVASTTTSTTRPATTSTTSTTIQSTTPTTNPHHHGGKSHTGKPAHTTSTTAAAATGPAKTTTTASTAATHSSNPHGHLAFTGAPLGIEALVSGALLVTGALLCRLARYRKSPSTQEKASRP
jgi:hypothetical protein